MSFPDPTVQSPGFRDAVFDFAERTRYEINSAGRELFQKGALSASRTFVAAVRVPNEQAFVIGGFTPRTGAEPPPVSIVGFDGAVLSGAPTPFVRDLGRVQAALLVELPRVQALLYTESPNLAAFAVAERPLPIVYGSGLIRRTQDDIPLAPWTARLEPEPVLGVVRANPRAPALLLGHRGVLAWNESNVAKLASWVAGLEESASVVINAELLGGAKPFPPGAHEAMRKSRVG